MLDLQTPLLTGLVVAVVGALVQVYSIVQDRKHTRHKDQQEDAKEPLVKRSMELGMLDQATIIQQRMIDAQGEEIEKLTLKVATLTRENKMLRDQMMDMFLQIREMERRSGISGTAPYTTPPPTTTNDAPT